MSATPVPHARTATLVTGKGSHNMCTQNMRTHRICIHKNCRIPLYESWLGKNTHWSYWHNRYTKKMSVCNNGIGGGSMKTL